MKNREEILRLREALKHPSDDGEFVHVRTPDLRVLLDHASLAYEHGIAEGERRERARVVAWLRERLIVGADAIERGEHEEGA